MSVCSSWLTKIFSGQEDIFRVSNEFDFKTKWNDIDIWCFRMNGSLQTSQNIREVFVALQK